MKRLLCIISSMNAGGAETFLMKIYRAMDQSRYQMDFCINRDEHCFYEAEIGQLGGKIFRIPPKSQSVKRFRTKLKTIVRDNHYRYVLRITSNAMGFMDLKIAKRAGAKVCAARSSNSSDGGGLRAAVAHRLGKWLYGKYVDVKIAPSDLAARYTFGKRAYRDGKVTILHNAIDPNQYQYTSEGRTLIRTEYGIPDTAVVMGHIGRFMPQKNHLFLLDVFSGFHQRHPESRLLLIGGGELESSIRARVNVLGLTDAVLFAGVRSDIPQLLSAMDVFVFPSLYEGMPNTVIEAQANGLPCLIADTITKEADITGLVRYLPLERTAEEWAEAAEAQMALGRRDTRQALINAKYDIHEVVKEFISLVFQEET